MTGPAGPDPIVQKPPTDVFTTQVAPALDQARRAIAGAGLRVYRVFLVIDRYPNESTRRRTGALQSQELVELDPAPKVRFASATQIAMSGGTIQAGSCFLEKISRSYTQNQLQGKNLAGEDLPLHWDFYYALKPLGEPIAEFYFPDSKPILSSTSWSIQLRPLNRRGPLNGATPDP